VTIFDAGEEHDLAYIAMEFLKGKDLLDFCKDGNLLPVPTVLSIVARVAEALAYAHRQNVVHRDIKPANIMYEHDSDTVKVTDFGIARITDSSKTKTGLVLGTPSFMSPEQLAGKKVDGRSDLYSLGVMLFQMLTGVLPFRGESMAELMYKIANEEAPDCASSAATCPRAWPIWWRWRQQAARDPLPGRRPVRRRPAFRHERDHSVAARARRARPVACSRRGRRRRTPAATRRRPCSPRRRGGIGQFEKTVVHNTRPPCRRPPSRRRPCTRPRPAARPMDDFEKTSGPASPAGRSSAGWRSRRPRSTSARRPPDAAGGGGGAGCRDLIRAMIHYTFHQDRSRPRQGKQRRCRSGRWRHPPGRAGRWHGRVQRRRDRQWHGHRLHQVGDGTLAGRSRPRRQDQGDPARAGDLRRQRQPLHLQCRPAPTRSTPAWVRRWWSACSAARR
jgi:serine/threonine protein kinase